CKQLFDLAALVREDIQHVKLRKRTSVTNANLCINGNVLNELSRIRASSIDAIITSPPYLNSFDYTDVYMPELWALGFVQDYEDVRKLRAKTFCSHVQVKWNRDENGFASEMKSLLASLTTQEKELWNRMIPKM